MNAGATGAAGVAMRIAEPSPASCLVCGTTPRRLHADHCHRHNCQRGRICPRCNRLMKLIDDGKSPRVPAQELQDLAKHAARCPDCAAGKPASAKEPYQMHLSIPDDLEKFLESYAKYYGISRSAAVRVLLYEAKNREEKP